MWWTWKVGVASGDPTVPANIRTLIRDMAEANPRWGAPRMLGELLKFGIDVCQATGAKYMGCRRQPPSQTWRTFLSNHVGQIVAADFFVVPTVTFRLVFVLGAARPRSAPHPTRGGHRASDGGVDGPAGARSVSVGRGASVSDP